MMRWKSRQFVRNLALALGLLTLTAWLAPGFFSAERYRRKLEGALGQELHRPATFKSVSFRMLPRPGFSIDNVLVREAPAFGSEPFARADRIDCDLRWHSLWRSRLEFARLRLDHPILNLVRNERGEWNFETLLLESGMTSASAGPVAAVAAPPQENYDLDVDDARINFKVGANKKPFALTELNAHLTFDPGQRRVRFRLAASPIRTDLSLPTPGLVELNGEWAPGKDLEGPLEATLRARGGLLYNWIPLFTGRNPEVYGVLDADARLSGSLHALRLEGDCRLAQLHRWQQLPPSDAFPWTIRFRGEFDRRRGRALVESLEAAFADSHLHLSGSVEKIPENPQLDLVIALERSRLEDFQTLVQRFRNVPSGLGVQGRVDAMLTIQGPWSERRYGGFLSAREVRLRTQSGVFPVSEVAVRIDRQGARLAPVHLALAPHVELVADGVLRRWSSEGRKRSALAQPNYEIGLTAKIVPLHDLLSFGRGLGLRQLQGLDAQGAGSASFRLAGTAWPLSRPTLTGHSELHAARLLVSGLTEPIQIPHARLEFNGREIIADPVIAVLGTSVFTARLEHHGERKQPWQFEVRVNALSIDQGALWFDVLGHRRPVPLLERIPGLSSSADRRAAAVGLFNALNARGHFATPNLTYRSAVLKDFRATVEISDRVVQVAGATFRVLGGKGQGRGQGDLTVAPARMSADVSLSGVGLQTLAARLPTALHGATGTLSVTGHLEAHGLTREEIGASLQGKAKLQLKNANLRDFDALDALARQAGWGQLEPARGETELRSAAATLRIGERRVLLQDATADLAGTRLSFTGGYNFDGTVDLDVRADLRSLRRRWLATSEEYDPTGSILGLRLTGFLDRLAPAAIPEVSRAMR